MILKDGTALEAVQPCLKGGRRQPLSDEEMKSKFLENARFGGWDEETAARLAAFAESLFDQPDISGLKNFGA